MLSDSWHSSFGIHKVSTSYNFLLTSRPAFLEKSLPAAIETCPNGGESAMPKELGPHIGLAAIR
jgi:hypothetical protein